MKKIIMLFVVSTVCLTTLSANNLLLKIITKKVVTWVKPSSNYRKTALKNTNTSKGGWITDPYSGRKCRKKYAHADHIWPKSKGGPNYSWNLIMSCAEDNIKKSDKIGKETLQGYWEKLMQQFD